MTITTTLNPESNSDSALPTLVYLHVGYEDSVCSRVMTPSIQAQNGFCMTVCESWGELLHAITPPYTAPAAVLIHLNALRSGPASLGNITSMINTVMSLYGESGANRIGIVVDDVVDIAFVKELRKHNILNIVPGVEFLGRKESTMATMALLSGQPYVPNAIKSMPENSLSRVISFWGKTTEQPTLSIQQSIKDRKLYNIDFCNTWNDLEFLLQEPVDLILFHATMCAVADTSATEIVDMITSMVKLSAGTVPKIAVVINKDTPLSVIKELRKTDVCGLVLSSVFWGVDVGTSSVNTILTTGSHWPKDVIDTLPGNLAKPVVVKAQYKLTGRQQQIVDLICTRGLSNKRIATTLRIAESTVKIHVSAALKAYGVRTRVQLALTANAMAPAQLKLTN